MMPARQAILMSGQVRRSDFFRTRSAQVGRTVIEKRHRHQSGRGQHRAQSEHELPGVGFGDPALRRLPGRDSDRPADDKDGVAEKEFLVGKPVGQHLRHQHDQYRAADAGRQMAEQDRVIGLRHGCDDAARDHQRHAERDDGLVAEAPAEESAGQRNRDARQNEPADKKPDLGVADAEVADQETARPNLPTGTDSRAQTSP